MCADTCQMDGYSERWTRYGPEETYWHCEDPATWIASRYTSDQGEEATVMRVCDAHVGEFEEAVEIPGATRSQRVSGSSS